MGTLVGITDNFGTGPGLGADCDTAGENCQRALISCESVRHPRIFRSPIC
jgi:hypothetical protein